MVSEGVVQIFKYAHGTSGQWVVCLGDDIMTVCWNECWELLAHSVCTVSVLAQYNVFLLVAGGCPLPMLLGRWYDQHLF